MINKKISSFQLSVIAFLSSVSFLSSMTGSVVNGNFYDSIISALISCALGIALSIPILMMQCKGAVTGGGATFKALAILYFIFFAYSMAWNLAAISNMLVNTIFPDVAPWLLIIPMLLVAFYGAFKGIEAIGRSAVIIMAVFVIGIVLIILGALPLIGETGKRVFFYEGYSALFENTLAIFARSTFLPQLVLLIAFAEDKKKGVYVLMSGFAGLFVSGILLITQLCLGQFLGVQQFPVYSLSAAAELVPLQRLDIIFAIVWLMTLLIRLTATMFAAGECARSVLGGEAALWGMLAVAVCSGGFAWFVTKDVGGRAGLFSVHIYFMAAVVLGTVVPVILYFIFNKKRKPPQGTEQH